MSVPLNLLIDFENGDLDPELVAPLFQRLVNTGIAWSLQGTYGRAAVELLEQGLISPAGEPDLANTRQVDVASGAVSA